MGDPRGKGAIAQRKDLYLQLQAGGATNLLIRVAFLIRAGMLIRMGFLVGVVGSGG